jgi:hypothetical protein
MNVRGDIFFARRTHPMSIFDALQRTVRIVHFAYYFSKASQAVEHLARLSRLRSDVAAEEESVEVA